VDDEQTVRRGLRMRLSMEPDFAVVGEVSDGQAALAAVADLTPDVVVMDLYMPVLDGLEATSALHEAGSPCAVVMLTMQDDAETRARAHAAGAVAFVSKHQIEGELAGAIRAAADHSRRISSPDNGEKGAGLD
jgi:DNA-binding NarL/FixJ family response regulator